LENIKSDKEDDSNKNKRFDNKTGPTLVFVFDHNLANSLESIVYSVLNSGEL